jgi:hypothetical protein
MVLLDNEKAYHTVRLNGLLYKLISLHLPDYHLFFFKSYLEGHTLTLNLLKTTIVAPPSNASKWQMEFNSAFKGLKSTWMTLSPPQNLVPPVFLRVLYYRLHYFPFTFLTCCILHTLTSPYTQTTLSFYLSLAVLTLSPADSVTLYKPYSNTFTTWKFQIYTHKNWINSIFQVPLPRHSSNPLHLGSTLFRPCTGLRTYLNQILASSQQQSHMHSL